MIPQLRRINDLLILSGMDFKRLANFLRQLPFFFRTLREFKKQAQNNGHEFSFGKAFPCLEDRYAASGSARGHYFHQDLLVARRIFANKPKVHLDIGSRIDGFVAHVASFRPVQVIDVRPMQEKIPNVKFIQLDITKEIDDALLDYCDSLSSLHALEHFGLGRYGDRIQCTGYLAGLENMSRILRKKGKFYLSVPIGSQRVEFNAHRVFDVRYLVGLFEGRFRVDSFSYVDDEGSLHEDVPLKKQNEVSSNFGCHFGCGIFEMTKIQ
jgi:SAM-dependent methyltransferase